MVTDFIVTESACEKLIAACGNKLAVPFVMFTTKYLFLFIPI
jgi:hypothetical protein